MAIYATFFLCEPTELKVGFPDWRAPLETPIRRETRNPFTGELMIVETREPEWPKLDYVPEFNFQAVEIEDSYEDYLEGRLRPFVRAHPHWAAKGLTPVELHPLLELLDVRDRIDSAMYSPPSSGDVLEELPQAFMAKLPSLNAATIAERWAKALSTPEHTHSVTGIKLSDGWTSSETAAILNPLVALGRQATPEQRMYLLTEV
jgi:hypothetical protein